MKIVMAVGGSILVPDKPDMEYIKRFAQFSEDLSKKHTLALVVGGGKTARNNIKEALKKGANNAECDYIGIDASRENARMLAETMNVREDIPENFRDADRRLKTEDILIMGGTEPGHSTDAVAAILAEYIGADLLIKITNVDGVYDKDPKKNPDAKMLDEINVQDALKMASSSVINPGSYAMIDLLAVKIVQRSKLNFFVVSKDLENLRALIQEKEFKGTKVIV